MYVGLGPSNPNLKPVEDCLGVRQEAAGVVLPFFVEIALIDTRFFKI